MYDESGIKILEKQQQKAKKSIKAKTHMGRKWKAMDTMYYKNVDIKIYANLSSLYQVVEKK